MTISPPAPRPEPVAHLMDRAAQVIGDCAQQLRQIEDNLAPLLAQGHRLLPVPGAPVAAAGYSVTSLQDIDLLWQTLDNLATWMADVAVEAAQGGGQVDQSRALAGLRLADLRFRLQSGETLRKSHPAHPVLF